MNAGGKIGIGLFGFGNIGAGVVRTLNENRDVIRRNLGFELEIIKIVDIDITTDRGIKVPKSVLSTDKDDIINNDKISIVIELIGGAGIAKTIVEKSLKAGKSVVSANKELMAKHGPELLGLAAKNNVNLLYEASVGGGIPIITPLLTCLRANRMDRIIGIVNGTTNYILTQMQQTGADFADILKEAQKKGFAEANPKNDIEGYDAAYKTVVLCSAGFGKRVDVADVYREGITHITINDIENAAEMGFTIKLLSVSENLNGTMNARVHPMLVPLSHPLANINGVVNAVYVEGYPIGPLMFVGRGAGPNATSSAVLGDVIAIATDTISKTATDINRKTAIKPIGDCEFCFYIRMTVEDRAGVLADITKVFGKHKVSIKSMNQHCPCSGEECAGGNAEIVWLTHRTLEKNVQRSLEAVRGLGCVESVDSLIRVLEG